jgi:peptide-methionine (S)-S-oxide reductase
MKLRMPQPDHAIPGRQEAMPVPETHFVNGHRIVPPFPGGLERAMFGMGCFWGAERKVLGSTWRLLHRGWIRGGYTPNATYREVCSG